MTFKVEREIGENLLSIETGKLAKQAAGAAVVRYGDTVVLGTVVTGPPREGIDFFPLFVDYREKMSAAGKFPGGFFKREGRPTQKEILTMRMIDRPVRPLFPKGFKDEVQIQIMVLSADLQNDPDVVGMVSASAALAVSGLPFNGPVAAVRVGRIDGNFVVNPTREQLDYSDIDLVVAGHKDAVNMIEVGARELPEDVVFEAIQFGHKHGVAPICEMLDELREHAGKPVTWTPPEEDNALQEAVHSFAYEKLLAAKNIAGKQERNDAVRAVYDETIEHFCPPDAEREPQYTPQQIKSALETIHKRIVREKILNEQKRSDGRGLTDIRPLMCEVGLLPRTHGSALFSRGETQALVTATLGTAADEQIFDELMEEYRKKFLLHYNFPPFSVGEVRRIMGPGRREIGHGALAERSLEGVLPGPDEFPYTIRLVSDILESNGSSSMASVCGGSLALMDAGVPIKGAVAGISIGLVQDDERHVIFADILGEEDHFGDMDFKVAGTRKGITGIQLDLKAHGLPFPLIQEAFELAKQSRFHILDHMDKTISAPRPDISIYAPRLLTLHINPEKIGKLIGPGGKTIRALQTETGA
ncbi:MAG: polyribonucleotide nucleotidyltransferase, partial [Planctomycetota bacterium]